MKSYATSISTVDCFKRKRSFFLLELMENFLAIKKIVCSDMLQVEGPGILFVLGEDGICCVCVFCTTCKFCRKEIKSGIDAYQGGSIDQARFCAHCWMVPDHSLFWRGSYAVCVSCLQTRLRQMVLTTDNLGSKSE